MQKEHFGVLLEDISGKLDLVLEGHQSLHSEIRELSSKTDERFDQVDFKLDTLNSKIDGVAADLKAHRADTEAHHGVYRVKEN